MQTNRHAVVIGASIAGLATARVLADHFDNVTVLERDHPPQAPRCVAPCPRAATCTPCWAAA